MADQSNPQRELPDGVSFARKPSTKPSNISGENSLSQMTVTSDEVNYLVFRYLQESGFVHSAFTFAHESVLGRSGLRAADKSLPPGALITFLQKGLQYVGIEEGLYRERTRGESFSVTNDEQDFSLLSPPSIVAITRRNPPIQLNVLPATAAAVVKARLEMEGKIEAERNAAAVSSQLAINGPLSAPSDGSSGLGDDTNAALARQALSAQVAAAAAITQLQQLNQPQIVEPIAHQARVAAAADMLALKHIASVSAQKEDEAFDERSSELSVGGKRTASTTKRTQKKQKLSATSAAPSSASRIDSLTAEVTQSSEPSAALSTGAMSDDHTKGKAMEKGGQGEANAHSSGRFADVSQEAVNHKVSTRQELVNGVPADNGKFEKSAVPHDSSLNGTLETSDDRNGFDRQTDPDDVSTAAADEEILRLEMHQSEVFMCAWNPVFTNLIATGSGDASARIWEMGDKQANGGIKTVKLLPHGTDPRDRKNKDVTTLEWSTDGNLLATGSYDGVARVWARNGALIHTLRGHGGPIFSLKWNRRGNYILSGSYDKTTIVWDVTGTTGVVKQQFTDHQAPALDVDWKDDETFASCSTDKTVHICRVGTPHPVRVFTGHTDEVNAVKWDPSGQLLASCSDDCTAKVWAVDSESTGPLHDFKSHQQEIYTVKWSPLSATSSVATKRALLATASFDGSVRLWNMDDGSCYRVFNRHRDSVYSVAFSPSGEFLASGSLAGQMYIWDIEEGRHVKSYKGRGDIFEVAWNSEETRVAACFSSNVVAIVDFDKSRIPSVRPQSIL